MIGVYLVRPSWPSRYAGSGTPRRTGLPTCGRPPGEVSPRTGDSIQKLRRRRSSRRLATGNPWLSTSTADGRGAAAEILKGLDAELGIDLAEAQVFGMRVGPAPIVVRCGGGHVAIDPIATTLNGGRVVLRPRSSSTTRRAWCFGWPPVGDRGGRDQPGGLAPGPPYVVPS